MNRIKKRLLSMAFFMAYVCAFTYVMTIFIIDNIKDVFSRGSI